ncbi:MAG: hypothetical protein IJW23_09420 [Lentisphaeria bacterium]|nr:hypothetical protein [Lentisphaeria bacterium]
MIYQDGRSGKWYRQPRGIKILLFSAVSLICIVVAIFFNRPERIDDLSGGIYKETFQTTYRPLQKELLLLQREGVFQIPENARTVPEEFSAWYASEETRKIIAGTDIDPEAYRAVVSASLQSGLQRKVLYFKAPLENPVPGDLFRTLLWLFEKDLASGDYQKSSESLENLFCFASLLLNSNAADIYFVSKSLECAEIYERTFRGNRTALVFWSRKKSVMTGKYLFSSDGLYRMERLRLLQEFEMIRIHGIRIFDEKTSGSSQIQEGLGNGSVSGVTSGIGTAITDFFYDVDRDQTLALSILRQLLYDGLSPYMIKTPDRKISIHCYRRITREAEVLSSLFEYLEKRVE